MPAQSTPRGSGSIQIGQDPLNPAVRADAVRLGKFVLGSAGLAIDVESDA